MFRLVFPLTAVLLLLVSCSHDVQPPVQVEVEVKPTLQFAEHPPQFVANFEADFLEQFDKGKGPGAAVVIIRDSTILLMKGYGLRDTESGDSVDINSVFRIASLSKGFSGVLAGKMVEEGCINWEDKVCESIPDFSLQDPEHARKITVKHILSHSSGFMRHAYTNLIEEGFSISEIVPYFSDLPVFGQVGKHFAYQNVAFSFIEEVLKDKTGDEFCTILESSIFDPLDMVQASCTYEDIVSNPNVAKPHWYSSRRGKYVPRPIKDRYYNVVSAGGINASISDMGKWLHLLVGNRDDVISDETLDYVFQPLVKSHRRKHNTWKGVRDCAYGIGWRVFDFEGRPMVYHGGYVDNYRSEIVIDREEKLAICVLFNAPVSVASKVVPLFLDHYEMNREVASVSTTKMEETYLP